MGSQFTNNLVRMTAGSAGYYIEYETTNVYVEKVFGHDMHNITVSNDSDTDPVQVSYDGATLEGEIKAGETMGFTTSARSSIYIKGTTGGDNVRCWSW